jgi:hypothetical protein
MLCANGAACVEGVDSYRCECEDGFTGEHCESDVDECEARPCLNDGTCFESGLAGFVAAGSRLCMCMAGYQGDTCENETAECASEPCENGGACIEGLDSFACECLVGFVGYECQVDVDECSSYPCANGAPCFESSDDTQASSSFQFVKPSTAFVGAYQGKHTFQLVVELRPYAANVYRIAGTRTSPLELPPAFQVEKPFGVDVGGTDPAEWVLRPDAQYDSFLTVGATDGSMPQGGNQGMQLDAWTESQGIMVTAGELFIAPDLGATGTVVLAQLTVPAGTSFTATIGVITGLTVGGETWSEGPLVFTSSPSEPADAYSCACMSGYSAANCQNDVDECASEPCQNSATCLESSSFSFVAADYYVCRCQEGYGGADCETDIDECASAPCLHDGACIDAVGRYSCTCVTGWTGYDCEFDFNECGSYPCLNSGICTDAIDEYFCQCLDGYGGENCAEQIDECASGPCVNGGICEDHFSMYLCVCAEGFSDFFSCNVNIDECVSTPCANDGICVDGIAAYLCNCADGWDGENCKEEVKPCENFEDDCDFFLSQCIHTGPGQHTCQCFPGYGTVDDGKTCVETDECASAPCVQGQYPGYEGTCVESVGYYSCTCAAGYAGFNCEVELDECTSVPCYNGATCIDQVDAYECICPSGFAGERCEVDMDECEGSPCVNGATCLDSTTDGENVAVHAYVCVCVAGYTDRHCDVDIDECASGPCENDSTCSDDAGTVGANQFSCTCLSGFSGFECQIDDDECTSDPCENFAPCADSLDDTSIAAFTYTCTCNVGYRGDNCEEDIDECGSEPCQSGAECLDSSTSEFMGAGAYTCVCTVGWSGENCDIDIDECESNPCSHSLADGQHGTCTPGLDEYVCDCNPGWVGTNCDFDVDDCESNPCENASACNDHVDFYTCDCSLGYLGANCAIDYDACALLPWQVQDGGVCMHSACMGSSNAGNENAGNEFTCSCMDGWSGDDCMTNDLECDSTPCQNGGVCTDGVGNYQWEYQTAAIYACACAPGFAGVNCEMDVSSLAADAAACLFYPCNSVTADARCEDTADGYTCTCPLGFENDDCTANINECESSPCQNGALCEDLVDTFKCYCPPGYSGDVCENVPTRCASHPCQNCDHPGTDIDGHEQVDDCCVEEIDGYSCICPPGYTGENCEEDMDECSSNPCQNGGTCLDSSQENAIKPNAYRCVCVKGFELFNCEQDADECLSAPCQNGAVCTDENFPDFYCECEPGFSGHDCQVDDDECSSYPCLNAAVCRDSSSGIGEQLIPTYDYVEVDTTEISSQDGHSTYRLSVQLTAAAANIYAIAGTETSVSTFPPAFQVPTPFGVDVAGTSPSLWEYAPDAQFDSWLTIGTTDAVGAEAISTLGIDFSTWTEYAPLSFSDGGIFFVTPADGPSGTVVLAQLTVPYGSSFTATVGVAQVRSFLHNILPPCSLIQPSYSP